MLYIEVMCAMAVTFIVSCCYVISKLEDAM